MPCMRDDAVPLQYAWRGWHRLGSSPILGGRLVIYDNAGARRKARCHLYVAI